MLRATASMAVRRASRRSSAGEAGVLGQVAQEEHVGRSGRPVGEDAAQGLEAAVEEESLLGEGAGRLCGQERGEESEKH